MTTIHLMGTNASHPRDFTYHLNGRQDWWLVIQTQTPAEFYIGNEFVYYPENQIVIYPPYSTTIYRAASNTYRDNWIRFYTNDSLITHSPLPFGVPFHSFSPVIHQLFQLIASENYLENEYKAASIDELFHLLFYKIMESYQHRDSQLHSQDLINLHFDILSNPSYPWTVMRMAKRLNISPGYLQAIYKSAFHVSCMEDVIQSRISLANDYLLHGNYAIHQIADLCGYQSIEHFSRQFHKIVGMTPNQYRKQNRLKNLLKE